MSATTAPHSAAQTALTRRSHRRWTYYILPVYTALVIIYLCLPIFVTILFGFNNTKGKYNTKFQGFTLKWYRDLFAIPGLTSALINTITIAIMATLVSVVLGSMLGLAMGRYSFRGKGATGLTLFAQIATPELVLGTSLLSMFLMIGMARGYWTILIAHVMFCIPFVAVTVQARVAGLNHSLEEASLDLGATPWVTFRKITLPMIMPGVVSGGLLALALSIDDYVTTSFNNGSTETFPLWVFGSSRMGIPPQVNVMGTLIFAFGVVIVVANVLVARKKKV
ncbi:MAG: ABC transporter permease [Actinomycetia bacterium]|nr:ABC transporter permease [Actinomycetes bacterium]